MRKQVLTHKHPAAFLITGVKLLALLALVNLAGCALTQQYILDRCNSRAHVRMHLADYISTRFSASAPVRMAVVPFSVPANLAARNSELPGIGNEMAWKLQSQFASTELIPIVEVLNRQDWPRKKEGFHTGNFEVIDAARQAGYDLLLVGNVNPLTSFNSLSADVRLIEAESRITIWGGVVTAKNFGREVNKELSDFSLATEHPALLATNALVDDLAWCITREIIRDDE